MKLSAPTLISAALATLAVAAAPAGADQRYVPSWRVSDVSAYGSDVVVTRQVSRHSYAVAQIHEDGTSSWLKIPASRHRYVTDVGSDRDGDRVVVYSRANRRGDHDLYVYDLRTQRERKLYGSARGTDERFPSIYSGEVVFFRSDAGARRNGIYRRAAYGPDRGKDRHVWRTSVARATDIEDGNLTFQTKVRAGQERANAIYATREDSDRPQLVAVSSTNGAGNRTAVSSPSISGGFLYYLRYDSAREPQHTVFRQLVAGTAHQSDRAARPADAEQLAVGGPRLLFTRSSQKGVHEVSAPEWLD